MPVRVVRKPQTFTRIMALPNRLKAGVAVKGDAARYALVWEWGSVRLYKPGPKTTWGSNPDSGQLRVFTKTAPSGYIRIHKQQFFDMVRLAVTSTKIQQELLAGTYAETLLTNLNRAAVEAAQLMAKDAPIDSGLLRASILAVNAEEIEKLLQAAFRPLLIGGVSDVETGS